MKKFSGISEKTEMEDCRSAKPLQRGEGIKVLLDIDRIFEVERMTVLERVTY